MSGYMEEGTTDTSSQPDRRSEFETLVGLEGQNSWGP